MLDPSALKKAAPLVLANSIPRNAALTFVMEFPGRIQSTLIGATAFRQVFLYRYRILVRSLRLDSSTQRIQSNIHEVI